MAKKTTNKKDMLEEAYIDRDLSWMYFNRRILQEATKPNIPLLERLSFLGIYSNNLDEFFRVRMATLSRIAEYEDKSVRKESEHAAQLIKQITKLNNRYAKEYEVAIHDVTECLRRENIFLLKDNELEDDQQTFVRQFFRQKLSGFVNPVWLSAVKELTEAADDNIYLAVKMHAEGKKSAEYALIEMPVAVCGRFIHLPDKDGKSYLMYLDDVIRFCLPMIFSGMDYTHFEAYAFKFTKDAEMEIDNDLRNGFLQKISKGVKSRRKGDALRVIYDSGMPKDLLKRVMNKLNLDKLDTVLAGGRYHNHKDLMSFPDCGRKDLKYPTWTPIIKPELDENVSLLKLIQQHDRYIHVPYHSFDYYIRVLQEAAISKNVKSIKTTLYRLAKTSKVVTALINAARNGKKVTVVIELLARFDEASNISWSKLMQDAGIHVIFGVEGLKVHSKITHIGMKTGNDIACISTGNFHEGNARIYTDFMLMTAAKNVVTDVANVFNFIEKPYTPVRFRELLVSPNEMKKKFLRLIDDEIKNKLSGKPAEEVPPPDRRRNQEQALRQARLHPNENQPYYGPRDGEEALRGIRRRCAHRHCAARQLLAGNRPPRHQRDHPHQRHHRPLFGALAHLHLCRRRRGEVFHWLGRLDAPQPGQPRRGDYSRLRPRHQGRPAHGGGLRSARHLPRTHCGWSWREPAVADGRGTPLPFARRIVQALS